MFVTASESDDLLLLVVESSNTNDKILFWCFTLQDKMVVENGEMAPFLNSMRMGKE